MRRPSAVTSLLLFVALVFSVSLISLAQTRDRFVISARAGGVNAVTGRATMRAFGDSEWQQLTIREDLDTGDVVRTGVDGRVEMLLNPGSYLRIGENSEFELADSSLQNLQVRLIKGTAIVEATGAEDTELLINIITPDTRLAIVRRGLYRLTVVPGDSTVLIVRKGRVMLDDSNTKVKSGNKVVFSSNSFSVAKLEQADKKNTDNLESWSKQRAETVAKANRELMGSDMNFLMAGLNSTGRRRAGSNGGIWMFNAGYGLYTFVPFFLGWGSPYGSSYRSFYGGYYDRSFTNGTSAGYYPSANPVSPASNSRGTYSSPASPSSPSLGPAPVQQPEPRHFPSGAERSIERSNLEPAPPH
jgi:hypothetical protein